jgi:hypothetical protein
MPFRSVGSTLREEIMNSKFNNLNITLGILKILQLPIRTSHNHFLQIYSQGLENKAIPPFPGRKTSPYIRANTA